MSDRTPVKRILILAANPKDAIRRRLDEEVREIGDGLKRSQHRDQFDLQQRWAVRSKDIRRALLELNPQIVHFCGYGDGVNGLAAENDAGQLQWIPPQALVDFFRQFAGIECVLLNACYAEEQAAAISQYIPYVIGMSQEIGDQAAIEFAVGFYDALGAGRSYEQAFHLGRSAIALYGLPEHLVPRMKHHVELKLQINSTWSNPERQVDPNRKATPPRSRPAPTPARAPDRNPRKSAAHPIAQNRALREVSQKVWWILVMIVVLWIGVGAFQIPDARSSELWGALIGLGAGGGLASGLFATVAQRQVMSSLQADQLILNCLIGMVAGALGWLVAASSIDRILPGAMTGSGTLVGLFTGLLVAVVLLWRLIASKR